MASNDLQDLTSYQVLQKLKEHPENEALQAEVSYRTKDPEHNVWIRNAMLHLFGTTHEQNTWANYIGEHRCYPQSILRPKTLDELVLAVRTGKEKRLHVRAVGSGHSISDVAPTDGILLDPHDMKKVLDLDVSTLKDSSSAKSLFSVESGIIIEDLNNILDSRNIALANMGAYDGQTLAGAISTGTHGTGVSLGPIASSVRSLTLVVSSGLVYLVEPTDGITDPTKIRSSNIILKQDDAWFRTAVVSMGCTGLIYSYVLAVEPAYYLQEFRTLRTWEALRHGLAAGAASTVLKNNRGYEIDINPYSTGGAHQCIQITHNIPATAARAGSRGWRNWLGGFLATHQWIEDILVGYLNWFPSHSPGIITSALETLETPDLKVGYVDKSFEVMNLGAVDQVKAFALELSLPCDESLVANVDKLLRVLDNAAAQKKWYMAGPVALRFVAASDAFVAPQAGRATCMAELDMLVGINTGKELLQYVKAQMCTPGSGIRVHWGLDLDTMTGKDAADMYPEWDKWLAVYKELNVDGMWDSAFTERLGISMGQK